jgi:hypothetical protein
VDTWEDELENLVEALNEVEQRAITVDAICYARVLLRDVLPSIATGAFYSIDMVYMLDTLIQKIIRLEERNRLLSDTLYTLTSELERLN